MHLPNSQLGLNLLDLALTLNQGLGDIHSLNRETRQKFYKTKVVGKDHFSGGGSGRTWAPCASGAMVSHFKAKFITQNL